MPKGSKRKHKSKKSQNQPSTQSSSSISIPVQLKQTPSNEMAGRRRRSNVRRRMRINRRVNNRPAAFRSVRIQVKNIFTYTDSQPRRWTWAIALSNLAEKFTMYDEFKCVHVRCIIRPFDSNQTSGLRSSLLLDGDGFGGWPEKAKHNDLFVQVSETPGAKLTPTYRPTTHVWRPTGPKARDWRKVTDAFTVMRLYFINSSTEADAGGVVEFTATLLARGVVHGGSSLFAEHLNEQHSDEAGYEMLQSPLEDY